MTARDIQRALIIDRYRRNFVMPNYTPLNWFECDVMEITQAGFFVEYEIKLTLSDFRADAKKAREVFEFGVRYVDRKLGPSKHQQISDAKPPAPSRFWFVCPENVIPLADVPLWAGLMYAKKATYSNRLMLDIVKKAPQIHLQKADPSIKNSAETTCYWRMHNLLLHGSICPPTESSNNGPVEGACQPERTA